MLDASCNSYPASRIEASISLQNLICYLLVSSFFPCFPISDIKSIVNEIHNPMQITMKTKSQNKAFNIFINQPPFLFSISNVQECKRSPEKLEPLSLLPLAQQPTLFEK